MSLKDKIVDSEQELVGKKIVAINLYDPYPLGYIIVEGGELICFEENDEIYITSYSAVERKLMYNNNLRSLLLEHGCITKEDHEMYENILKQKKEKLEKAELEREYKKYLELKAKFEPNS